MKTKTDIIILDTNIFLLGVEFNLIKGAIYTTPSVIDEIRVKKYKIKNRNILNRIEAALESKKLIIKSPKEKYINEVRKNSKITGDLKALSKADIDLIALTLELKDELLMDVILYTNDYSMENVCVELDIPYSPLGKDGIQSKIIWEVYCPFCQDVFEPIYFNSQCERCGQKLKRRKKLE